MQSYTQEKILGTISKYRLPDKFSLILEGGGMRGFFSAGVMDAFFKADIMFPYVIGVSAGAANALSYISGQFGRNKNIIENYVSDKRYIGLRNIFTDKSILGFDFIFHEVPQKHCFFDWDKLKQSSTRFFTGAFDCETGKTIWYEKEELDENLDILKASCSIPFAAPIVLYKNKKLLDGGIVDAIPINKSLDDGNEFHVIILTRNKDYRKTPTNSLLAKILYRKYPKLIEALKNRHITYNKQLKQIQELEEQGKALIIRPSKPLQVDRIDTKKEKLLELYREGFEEAQSAIEILRHKLVM